MRRALRLIKRANPPVGLTELTVELTADLRRKTRQVVRTNSGEEIAWVLPAGTTLEEGDQLMLEDGSLVRVEVAREQVLVVTATDELQLRRAAYHLGNRHVPVEIGKDHLKLASDPVLRTMLEHFDLRVEESLLPFRPESGAYGGGHRHGHDETFADDHALAKRVFHHHHGTETADSMTKDQSGG